MLWWNSGAHAIFNVRESYLNMNKISNPKNIQILTQQPSWIEKNNAFLHSYTYVLWRRAASHSSDLCTYSSCTSGLHISVTEVISSYPNSDHFPILICYSLGNCIMGVFLILQRTIYFSITSYMCTYHFIFHFIDQSFCLIHQTTVIIKVVAS